MSSTSAQNFWTCSNCKAQVPNGCTHHCPTSWVNPIQPIGARWVCCGQPLEGPHDPNCYAAHDENGNTASRTIARLEEEVTRLTTRGRIALRLMTDRQREQFHRRCWELEADFVLEQHPTRGGSRMIQFQSVSDVLDAHRDGLIDRDEARHWLGFRDKDADGDGVVSTAHALAEAERVIRVISGWDPDRVSTKQAIQPAIDYLDAHGG